jgi:acyl-CoA synthetase (AMP-forming)/AMP-acid ligase II
MISHYNVISNVLQHVTYDSVARARKGVTTQAVTGFLPFSHIYGLVIMAHTSTWRGDQVIVLPRFDFQDFLKSVQHYKIMQLFVVSKISLPPILIAKDPSLGATDNYPDPPVQRGLCKV